MKEYPDELTWEEFDDMSWDQTIQIGDEKINPDTLVIKNDRTRFSEVKKMAKDMNWQIYTQVDLESGDIGYSKGPRIVNSTGIYELVKKFGFEVDNS